MPKVVGFRSRITAFIVRNFSAGPCLRPHAYRSSREICRAANGGEFSTFGVSMTGFDREIALCASLFVAALLYTSVGHAGSSAYIAAMALFSVPATVMRPTALVLNILVAGFGALRFTRAGLTNYRLLLPLLIGAVPMAFLGGMIPLSSQIYRPLIGVVLLLAAARLLFTILPTTERPLRPMPFWLGIVTGAGIGLLSGLTGTGGGIFLSPLLVLMAWAGPRETSGTAIVFILANSIAGLLGNIASVQYLPPNLPYYAASAMAGAFLGTFLGINLLANRTLLKVLGVVLLIAGLKLIGIT